MDLLGTIVDTQLKAMDFLSFKVADAFEVIEADIVKEVMPVNCGCSAADLVSHFSENFPQNFTQGHYWLLSILPSTTTPENLSYMITLVKTTIRLNTAPNNLL